MQFYGKINLKYLSLEITNFHFSTARDCVSGGEFSRATRLLKCLLSEINEIGSLDITEIEDDLMGQAVLLLLRSIKELYGAESLYPYVLAMERSRYGTEAAINFVREVKTIVFRKQYKFLYKCTLEFERDQSAKKDPLPNLPR